MHIYVYPVLFKILFVLSQEQEEKTEKAIEEALTAARDKWRQDTDEQATRDWVNGQEREKQNEFETRLTSAMDQAKSRWEREHAEGAFRIQFMH